MLYIVQPGDTLNAIASRFGVSVQSLMNSNIVCNPNLIFPGTPLIIPRATLQIPRAGGYPYYVVLPGDTLGCIAYQFGQSVESLMAANNIQNLNVLLSGSELLVQFPQPNPDELFNTWDQTGRTNCDQISSLQAHGIFYIGSFQWEALGERAVSYLSRLLDHPCAFVRRYAVISLGRIGTGNSIRAAIEKGINDENRSVADAAQIAYTRFQLIPQWSKRVHILTQETRLLSQPTSNAQATAVIKGTPVIVWRWNIPSPTGEEGPQGDIQIYDYVQLASNGQFGYIPRVGYNEIPMI